MNTQIEKLLYIYVNNYKNLDDLAEDMGIHRNTLSNIMRGKTERPHFRVQYKINEFIKRNNKD